MAIDSAKSRKLVWRLIRRALDYGVAVGAALLCGYWIIEVRW
ncbi:MAG TPA: hypothetical protein VN861_16840 [Candidatus Acidoferrales bacterium]|nr:hypothetical protein [Candidatus Acidoferrales bacterium]